MSIKSDMFDLINESVNKGTSAYESQAKVVRVDGDTLWVHIAGGVDETPVKRTINARVGDTVQVRVSGGRAYVQGNETNPPTDDRTANIAKTTATNADKTATKALETAEGFEKDIDNLGQRVADANERVDGVVEEIDVLDGKVDDAETAVTNLNTRVGNAESSITTVEGDITNLQGRVTDAEDDIDDTLAGLALAQNVIGTLQWITAHSTVTTDTTPQAGTTYYIKNQDGTFEVVTDTAGKNPAQEGWYVMDESVQNYIASHIALTQDGLVVTKDNTKWKVLIKDDGVYIIDNTSGLNEVVAKYKDIIQLGQDEHSRLEITSNSLKAFNEENAEFFKVDYDGLEYLETLGFQISSAHKKRTSNRYWFSSDDIECDAMANSVGYTLDNSEYENGAYINTHVLYKNSAGNITFGGALSIIPDLYRYDTGVAYDVFASTNCQVYRLDGNTSSIFVVVPTIPTITLGSTSDFTVTSSVVIRANFNGNYIYFKRVMITDYISATRRLRQQLYEPSASGSRNDTYAIIDNTIHGDVTKDVTTKAPSYTLGTDIGAVKGAWSARIGRDLIAQDENQTAIGKYNNNKNGNLFEVGNGTSDSARSNAFEVADGGDILSSGDIEDGTGNILSDKADASSLATVATSGSYNDLADKPTIPTASQQVWYGTCSTGASIGTKVVNTTSGDFDFKAGNVLYVRFTNGNTSTSSLSVNVDGTTKLLYFGNGRNGAHYWNAYETLALVYSGTYFYAVNQGIASTDYYGMTKLEDSVTSTSTSTSATPNAVKQAYDLANRHQDYITAQGTSGEWTYRKWNSGKIEAWCEHAFGSQSGTVWTSFLRFKDLTLAIPSGIFTSAPSVHATSSKSQWQAWYAYASSESSVTVRCVTPVSASNPCTVSFYCVQG